MADDVFAHIRRSCLDVAQRAGHVHLDVAAARARAWGLAQHPPPTATDPGRQRHGTDEAAAAFIVSLDAINFGSGYFPHIEKRPGHSGYHTVAAAWHEHATAAGGIRASDLVTLTPRRCAEIFGQSAGNPLATELMGHFADALEELGQLVVDEYDGSVLGLVEDADHSAARMVALLDRLPHYHDVAVHRDAPVAFYKRAQITAFDLATAFEHRGPGRFDDLHRLTMFADNLVPHVLRVEGVLQFSDDLVARIERGDDIPAGSDQEIEIRACGVTAVEIMVTELRTSGLWPDLTPGELDGRLWARGARPEYKAEPRHRTRCVFY